MNNLQSSVVPAPPLRIPGGRCECLRESAEHSPAECGFFARAVTLRAPLIS
jgi:hypothetical protein